MEHPSEDDITALVEGSAEPADAERLRTHVAQCEPCLAMVAELSRHYSRDGIVTASNEPGEGRYDEHVELEAGTTVGRYVVLSRVGAGAMGVVYSARDPVLGRTVALKVLRQTSPEYQAQLLREARTLARLNHPHVSAVYDAGTEKGPWIAMEYLEGSSLRVLLNATKPDFATVTRLFRQVGEGLAAAHAIGIVQRDFKPENVMVTASGRAVVTDFGLANAAASLGDFDSLAVEGDDMLATRKNHFIGTPAYMSPEQFEGQLADARSDQFSFCVSLHEALTGTRPFLGATMRELRDALRANLRVKAKIRAPTARVERKLQALLTRGLAIRPAERFVSMRALLTAFDDALRPPSRGWRWPAAAGAALAVVLGGLGLYQASTRCTHAGDSIALTWSPEQFARIASTFRKSPLPFAEHALAHVEQRFEHWANDWRATQVAVCEASRQNEIQGISTARLACLERQRQRMTALIDVYAAASDAVITDVDQSLPTEKAASEQCSAAAVLRSGLTPPPSEALRDSVTAIEPEISRVDALLSSGQYELGSERARALSGAVDAIGYAPLTARHRMLLGWAERALTRGEPARKAHVDCLRAALEAGDRATAADCALGLMTVESEQLNSPDGERVAEAVAAGLVNQLGEPDRQHMLLMRQAEAASRLGKHQEAVALLTRDVELTERVFGPNSHALGQALFDLGGELCILNRLEEGERALTKTLAIAEQALGPQHPEVAGILNNLLTVYASTGRFEQAQAAGNRVLAIRTTSFGPDSVVVLSTRLNLAGLAAAQGHLDEARVTCLEVLERLDAQPHPDERVLLDALSNVGTVLRMQGQSAKAVPYLERAMPLAQKFGTLTEANTGFELARALADSHQNPARATTLATQARSAWLAAGHFDAQVAEVNAFLGSPAAPAPAR